MAQMYNIQNDLAAKLKAINDQSIANANGIQKANTTLDDTKKNTEEALNTIDSVIKGLVDVRQDLAKMTNDQRAAATLDSQVQTEQIKNLSIIKQSTNLTQKMVIVFGSIITALLLIIALFTWKASVNTSEAVEHEKAAIVSWYENIAEEYGIEFPEFPDFPDLTAYGASE